MRNLIHHTQCHRLNGRTGETSHYIAEDGTFFLNINGHPQQSIDQGKSIGSCFFRNLCHFYNISNIGREFGKDRFRCVFSYLVNGVICCLRVGAKSHSAVFYIGARNIDLQCCHIFFQIENGRDFAVIFHTAAGDIYNDGSFVFSHLGQYIFDKNIDTGVFQTDRVQYSRRSLSDTRRNIARTSFQRRSFYGNGT